MVLMQLCDQESFLICSNLPLQLSTKPCEVNSVDLQHLLREEREREDEMKEFVETSTKLLESVEVFNPLAFVSRKYQTPCVTQALSPCSSQSQYPPRRNQNEPKVAEERKTTKSSNTLLVTSTPQKRPPLVGSSTSKFHSKRIKTKVCLDLSSILSLPTDYRIKPTIF
jgi:hypothetical protein